jgi:hypothetical protein
MKKKSLISLETAVAFTLFSVATTMLVLSFIAVTQVIKTIEIHTK